MWGGRGVIARRYWQRPSAGVSLHSSPTFTEESRSGRDPFVRRVETWLVRRHGPSVQVGAAVRILVIGACVIGSVYAGKLLEAGHEVVLLARGRRLADLQASGLILEEAQSGQRTALSAAAVAALDPADRYDLVLVPVRAVQLTSTLPLLTGMRDCSDVVFFGNTTGRQAQLVGALRGRSCSVSPRPSAPVTAPSAGQSCQPRRHRHRLDEPGIRDAGVDQTPAGRLGTGADTADLVRFLLAERGSWINGQLLFSNGGFRTP